MLFSNLKKPTNLIALFLSVVAIAYSLTNFEQFTINSLLKTQNALIALAGIWLLYTSLTSVIAFPSPSKLFKKAERYQQINAFIGVAVILLGLNAEVLRSEPLTLGLDKLYYLGIGLVIMLLGASEVQAKTIEWLRTSYNAEIRSPERSYRPEVDGLRAIAVLAVIAYHYGVAGFDGGFVGVDVFFVISGYLISGILARELSSGTFNLTRFYERRVRRIFPALGGLLLFALTFGLIFFDPDRLVELTNSAFATTFFTSNFHFLSLVDYFDTPATLKPLLHTWSLAVEEQFYIFFPILLYLIWKFARKHIRLAIILTALASFVAAVIITPNDPSTAFYMFHLRAWELLAGAFITIGLTIKPRSDRVRQGLSFLGLGLILISVFTYNYQTTFPGVSALLPILGSYFVISMESGKRTAAGAILAAKPMVFIGKISYSLYLYHWTLFVFAGYLNILPLSTIKLIAVTVGSFILATLSWKFIETPFRSSQKWDRAKIFKFGFAYLALFGVITVGLIYTNGIPARYPWYSSQLSSAYIPEPTDYETCFDEYRLTTDFNGKEDKLPFIEHICRIGDPDADPSFAIWGDSHAHAMSTGLDLSAKNAGKSGYILIHWACTPLLGVDNDMRDKCIDYTAKNLNFLVEHTEIDTVFITSMWKYNTSTSIRTLTMRDFPSDSPMNNDQIFEIGLTGTLKQLTNAGKNVVLIQDVPTALVEVIPAYTATKFLNTDLNAKIGRTKAEITKNYKKPNNILKKVAAKFDNITNLDPVPLLCPDEQCLVVKDDYPLYRDNNHLNWYGSKLVSSIFDDYFSEH